MKKNIPMFFTATTFALVAAFVSAAPQAALAYAVGPTAGSTGSAGAPAANYDIGNSFQNLAAPFTGFLNSLKWSNATPIPSLNMNGGTGGGIGTGGFTMPSVSGSPQLQALLMGWLQQFDNWFYGISGVHVAPIVFVILNAIAWTLGLAQQAVNWLLGAFHQ